MTRPTVEHELHVLPDAAQAAAAAAEVVAAALIGATRSRGQASVAFSGGRSPQPMLADLAERRDVAWSDVDVFQVDERVAPPGDPARNLTSLHQHFIDRIDQVRGLHPIPVELGAEAAALTYSDTLRQVLHGRGRLDVVHLGLGDDGHTASLVPGDAALAVDDSDVAATGEYQGHRRVTLTYPALDRSLMVVWLVTGATKAHALAALLASDPSIPASGVHPAASIIVADRAAAT